MYMNQTIKREEKVTVGNIVVEKEETYDGIFVQAVATIYVPMGPKGHSLMQRIRSGGCMADADSSKEYYEILGKEEVEQVKEVLAKLGVKA
jgi:hypothetical protein